MCLGSTHAELAIFLKIRSEWANPLRFFFFLFLSIVSHISPVDLRAMGGRP